jgi:hypothetical protein
MSKKCLGCGIELQDKKEDSLGYTPSLEHDYCMRCFKIKNYGKNINENITFNNEELIKRINEEKIFTLYLIDYLNINDQTIDTYKKIKNTKVLVVTKKDLFPKNIIVDRYLNRIKKEYSIEESIFFISTLDNLSEFYNLLIPHKKVLVAGYTSAGKSSLINKLMDSHILESKLESTTLDFIEVKNKGFVMIDTPGFVYDISVMELKRRINQNVKGIKDNEEIQVKDVIIRSNVQNNLVFFIPNDIKITKRKSSREYQNRINIPKNSDLVIKGIGFINIKHNSILFTNMDENRFEIRDSLVGADHE